MRMDLAGLVAAATLALAVSGCGGDSSADAGRIGVAYTSGGHTCFDIRNAGLSPGQRLPFLIAANPRERGEIEIGRKLELPCIEGDPRAGYFYYDFKVVSGKLPEGAPALALTSAPPANETYRSCGAPYGVHLTVWGAKPFEAPRKWHEFYYLGRGKGGECLASEAAPDAD